ncbi:MAG: GDP-mannose 4,6-dehydratase [Candidatus Zixiibacteriota bacterium]
MKRPVAFITGIAGFAGSHLAEELLRCGYIVCGTLAPGESSSNLATIEKDIKLAELDILDADRCRQVTLRLKPDYLFHLAAFASVGKSFANERLVYRVNFDGTLNLLAAALRLKHLKKFIFVSSSDCYGVLSPKNKTLTEQQPFNPISPYGISKAAAEFACLSYLKRFELPVTVARSFNHSGPRQSQDFVIPSFARQIALIEKKRSKPVIRVGDLSVKRDLSDVRDIVRGYRLLAQRGAVGQAYNLCSGKAVSIKSVLQRLIKLSKMKIDIVVDPALLRSSDIPVIRGDNTLAAKKLGYRSNYDLNETLQDTLDFFRQKT